MKKKPMRRAARNLLKKVILWVRSVNNEIENARTGIDYDSSDDSVLAYITQHEFAYREPILRDNAFEIFYNKSDWFSGADNLDVYGQYIIVNGSRGMSYLSYKEQNCKFDLPGTDQFHLEPGSYTVDYSAAVMGDVDVKLLICAYVDGAKTDVAKMAQDLTHIVKIDAGYDSLRLALRFSGKGAICLERVNFTHLSAKPDYAKYDTVEFRPLKLPGESETREPKDGKKEKGSSKSKFNAEYAKIYEAWQPNFEIDIDPKTWHSPANKNLEIFPDVLAAARHLDGIYISYLEHNCAFSRPPVYRFELPGERFRIQFAGDIEGDLVPVFMIVIFDKDNRKLMNLQIPINNDSYVYLPKENFYRFAVRLSGKGILSGGKITFTPQPGEQREVLDLINANAARMSRPPVTHAKNSGLKIGVILDEFSMECFKNEAEIILLDPKEWKDQIDTDRPDFIFVESAWRGNSGSWANMIAHMNLAKATALPELIRYCKETGIKTVFWNKEDPVNYEVFIDAARLFDYVFTTDMDRVPQYKQDLGHDNVHTLPFAANPVIHNPIDKDKYKTGVIAFAGSWLEHRHAERREDMTRVLGPALGLPLHIFDRNFDSIVSPNYRFPEKYQDHIVGKLPFELMSSAYKMYNIFLNVNTVADSPTMFSRRVFELLACGTNVVSGYAAGIDMMLTDITLMSKTAEQTLKNLNSLLDDPELRCRMSALGIREVLGRHTYRHRFRYMLSKIGMTEKTAHQDGVLFVSEVSGVEQFNEVLRIYYSQSISRKQLLVLAPEAMPSREDVDDDVCVRPKSEFSGDLLTGGHHDFVCVIDPRCDYYEDYAADCLIAQKYSGADVVGKNTCFKIDSGKNGVYICREGNEYTYAESLRMQTLFMSKSAIGHFDLWLREGLLDWRSFFDLVSSSSDRLTLYSADKYNFALIHDRARINPETDRLIAETDDYSDIVSV